MRVTREIGFFSLLLLAALLVQNASATLPPMLPTSSYADGAWQGFRIYDEDLGGGDFLRGRVDFAVYDTENLLFPDESAWVGGLDILYKSVVFVPMNIVTKKRAHPGICEHSETLHIMLEVLLPLLFIVDIF